MKINKPYLLLPLLLITKIGIASETVQCPNIQQLKEVKFVRTERNPANE